MYEPTLGRTLEALAPLESALQFDFKFLAKVCKLERPASLLKYREVSLLCNTMCLLSLAQHY
jgi:hypothetical protein